MKRFLTVLVVVVFVGMGVFFGVSEFYAARLERTRRLLVAAGRPAVMDDLGPRYFEGSEEAGRLYDSAAAGLEKQALGALAHYDTLGWREDPAGLDSLLRAKAPVLDQLLRATALGPARFHGEESRDRLPGIVAPVGRFREFHLLFHLHARNLMNRGDADSALAVLGRAFGLVEACAEPLLIYWLVGARNQDSCLGLVARAAPRASDRALHRAVADLSRPDPTARLVRALEAEVLTVQEAMAIGIFHGRFDEEGRPAEFSLWWHILPVRRWVQWRQLEHGRRQLELLGQPWHAAHAALARNDTAATGTDLAGRLLSAAIPGEFEPYATDNARLVARRDAALAGLRVELLRRELGRVPSREEVGVLPADPFTGEPMRFVADDAGFAVYSLGPDRSDDGGDPARDIVFRVAR